MIHVGIDLHSRNMTLVAINDNGKVLDEQKTYDHPGQPGPVFRAIQPARTYRGGMYQLLVLGQRLV